MYSSMKYIFFFLLFISSDAFSQAPSTKIWDYRFGGSTNDVPHVLLKTLDKGFLLCGNSNSSLGFEKSENSRGLFDYWIVRVDSNGLKLWDKTFGGSRNDELLSAVLLPDSGFLLGGYSASDTSQDKTSHKISPSTMDSDYWIVRIDKN